MEGEGKLLREARRGREASFLEVYQRHRDAVYGFAYRLTLSAAAAEDVTQDCFLALLGGARFDERQGTLRTYLLGIARHLAWKRMRAAEREAEETEEIDAGDPLCELLEKERAALVERAIAMLPLLQREAILLFEYEELSLEEIAQVTGVDVGAVKARLHRARRTLERRLAPLLAPCRERS